MNSNSEDIEVCTVVISCRVLAACSNFHKWTSLVCVLTLLWTLLLFGLRSQRLIQLIGSTLLFLLKVS